MKSFKDHSDSDKAEINESLISRIMSAFNYSKIRSMTKQVRSAKSAELKIEILAKQIELLSLVLLAQETRKTK